MKNVLTPRSVVLKWPDQQINISTMKVDDYETAIVEQCLRQSDWTLRYSPALEPSSLLDDLIRRANDR